jgi:hypothetical protein
MQLTCASVLTDPRASARRVRSLDEMRSEPPLAIDVFEDHGVGEINTLAASDPRAENRSYAGRGGNRATEKLPDPSGELTCLG